MEKQKQRFAAILVFGGIAFYFGLTHFNTVTHWASALVGLCTPAVIGGIIAFLLNVPMTAIENGLKKLIYRKHPPKPNKALRMLSLLLTFVCIIVVVALAVVMLIPELRKSIMSVIAQIQKSLPAMMDYLYSLGIDTTWLEQQIAAIDLAAIDFKELFGQMLNGASSMLGTLVGAVSATVSVLGNALFSTVIALYILIDKENLSRQCRKLLYAFVKPELGDKIWHVGSLIRDVFGRFLGGQSIESCVLGILMFVALSVFRIPYASLIAVLTAVTIVLGMRMMGALLISSLIIFPALTSMRVCKTFKSVMINSAVISVVCLVTGITVSYVWATPAGASVVMANIAALLVYSLIGLIRNKGK